MIAILATVFNASASEGDCGLFISLDPINNVVLAKIEKVASDSNQYTLAKTGLDCKSALLEAIGSASLEADLMGNKLPIIYSQEFGSEELSDIGLNSLIQATSSRGMAINISINSAKTTVKAVKKESADLLKL
jgi:hypothetical protein